MKLVKEYFNFFWLFCLALSIIRYVSRVKWCNPGKGVAPSPIPQCSSYWKGSLPVAFDYYRQLHLLYECTTRDFNLMPVYQIDDNSLVQIKEKSSEIDLNHHLDKLLRYTNRLAEIYLCMGPNTFSHTLNPHNTLDKPCMYAWVYSHVYMCMHREGAVKTKRDKN